MQIGNEAYDPLIYSNPEEDFFTSNGFMSATAVVLVALLTTTVCASVIGIIIFARWLYTRSQHSQISDPAAFLGGPGRHEGGGGGPALGEAVTATPISLSTPDFLQPQGGGGGDEKWRESSGGRYSRTVIKQQTMPAISHRHLSFHRQLSHRLDESSSTSSSTQPIYGSDLRSSRDQSPCLSRDTSDDSLTTGSSITPSCSVTSSNGRLYVSLRHENDTVTVHIHRAEGLPARDFSGTTDPYVKVSLLPDRKAKRQTRVHRKTLNPVFDELFTFSIPPQATSARPENGGKVRGADSCVLQLGVYDFDRFSRHDLIGVCFIRDLFIADFRGVERHYVLDIIAVQQCGDDLGDLMLALRYLPTAGRLTVTIMKARNLRQTDTAPSTASSGVYVKITLMCRGRRIKKRKTSTRKGTLCPVFNDSVVFDVPQDSVEDVCLFIKIIELDSAGRTEVLGVCGVGPRYVAGRGREHWLSMLENPRRSVAQWYPLMDRLVTSSSPTDASNMAESDVTNDSACQTSNSDSESVFSISDTSSVTVVDCLGTSSAILHDDDDDGDKYSKKCNGDAVRKEVVYGNGKIEDDDEEMMVLTNTTENISEPIDLDDSTVINEL